MTGNHITGCILATLFVVVVLCGMLANCGTPQRMCITDQSEHHTVECLEALNSTTRF